MRLTSFVVTLGGTVLTVSYLMRSNLRLSYRLRAKESTDEMETESKGATEKNSVNRKEPLPPYI